MEDDYRKTLEDHEKRITDLEKKLSEELATASPVKMLSIKELMLSKKPKDDIQKTLLIGYYLEKYSKLADFTPKDLKDGFGNAKEPLPENMSDKIAKNIKKGHLMELPNKNDGRRALAVTSSGEKFVENDFKE